ncbi:GAF and ANTAR domain-containing protein [Nocardioides abyssi]|uniref:GAF and ANTAR domain-containing protein n=1 Tax=Nocardioides abyssi TaxID=3058370 RepID=A0ABT8EXN2_9ACTN|nr:GAF and ANTAR domain-containing protein [Nocardioides abyssi]MDN4162893.1 GAF and ANTAR domain-containing protein [Nocardioides abyssi]
MRTRLDSLLVQVDPDSEAGVLVAELETAYEELRVADEEVRAQQEHIVQLLERSDVLRWQHERMLAVLPVPVLTTDRVGVVRAVNAAAAGLFSRRITHLVGKPLVTLVSGEDRPDLRRFLGGVRVEGGSLRRVVTLVHRDATAESVELQATASPGGDRVDWLVLRTHDPDAPEHAAHRLAPAMISLIGLPSRAEEPAAVLREVARTCAEALGPGVAVSATIGPPLEPEAIATSDEVAQGGDGAQVALGDGPCHAAYVAGETVVCADVRGDERWPGLADRLPSAVRAIIAAPTEAGDRRAGALNVYLDRPHPSADLVEGVEMLASTVGAALHEMGLRDELARLSRDLDRALSSRAVIDQAKGIVMAARRCTAEEAFAHLVDLASTQHLKLRDLAARIVAGAAAS